MAKPKEDLRQIQDRLIAAMLAHVPFDGFSQQSLNLAVKGIGLDAGWAVRAFPGGMTEVAEHYCRWLDRQTETALQKQDLGALKIRRRIALGVKTRLQILEPHREAVRRIVSFMSFPSNLPLAAACIYGAVDTIWRAAGDTSTDWNFYSKRGLLAGVYSATLLHWLADSSEGYEETWGFLDRRINEVLQIPKLKADAQSAFERLADPVCAMTGLKRRRNESSSPTGPTVNE